MELKFIVCVVRVKESLGVWGSGELRKDGNRRRSGESYRKFFIYILI